MYVLYIFNLRVLLAANLSKVGTTGIRGGMRNPKLCKQLIEMILSDTIGKITYISVPHSINTYEQAKSVRFDVLVQAASGKFYDVEMQVSNERKVPKRMRFYQAAIDISFLDKGNSYNNLNDTFIIFICLFDVIGKNRPVYTFENICLEDNTEIKFAKTCR